jgi:hypothetical protein
MSPTFKFGVTLVLLITVATVLIAPTIDMPETTLREHRVASSHGSGEHTQGGFSIVSSASSFNWHAFEMEERRSPDVQTSDRASGLSTIVLRC